MRPTHGKVWQMEDVVHSEFLFFFIIVISYRMIEKQTVIGRKFNKDVLMAN